jgi:hypothetical protein
VFSSWLLLLRERIIAKETLLFILSWTKASTWQSGHQEATFNVTVKERQLRAVRVGVGPGLEVPASLPW